MTNSFLAIPQQTVVLIVGAGPVGLALALDLGWRGISCLIVDQGTGDIAQGTAAARAAPVLKERR